MPPFLLPIIFSGPGSNLYPLCDASSSSPSACKALLPVANRPLLAYALQNLLSAGLTSCLLLAPASQHAAITRAISTFRLVPPISLPMPGEKRKAKETKDEKKWVGVSIVDSISSSSHQSTSDTVSVKVELLPLGPYDGRDPDDNTQNEGFRRHILETAELLRWIASLGKLEADPLVIPVDLISPSMPLRDVIDLYIEGQATLHGTPTACCALYERGAGDGTGRERERDGPPRMLSAYSTAQKDERRLLMLQDADISTDLLFKRSLLKSCPLMRLSTNLLDSHIYIFKRSQVIPLLEANPRLTSLREHILPLIAKASWQTGLKQKANWHFKAALDENKEEDELRKEEESAKMRLAKLGADESLTLLSLQRSSTQQYRKDVAMSDDIRCLTVVSRLEVSTEEQNDPLPRFISRANTVPTYLECNRWLLKAFAQQSPLSFSIPSISTDHVDVPSMPNGDPLITASAQISSDSLIGAGVKIGDRASIKRTVAGNKCEIARGARLSGCVLMEGCKILDNARLENVIVCSGAVIGERCTLKECDVGAGSVIPADTSAKNEKMVDDPSDVEISSDES